MSLTHLHGDCREVLRTLPDRSVHCCVTSPPYWGLRDYGVDGQLGLERTPEEYVANMVQVFREVRRVLRDDGTLWLNIGDSYSTDTKWGGSSSGKNEAKQGYPRRGIRTDSGCKPKDLVGIPWMLAFALRADGWYLRQDIIWHKPNPMPESVTDRCTKAHEYIFLMSKSGRYYFDAQAIAEEAITGFNGSSFTDGKTGDHQQGRAGQGRRDELSSRNKRSVWTVSTKPYKHAHFAVFPPDLIEPCILAGTSDEGCCDQCGAPFERITDSERVATRPANESKVYGVSGLSEDNPHERQNGTIVGNRDPQRHVTRKITKGWQPTCKCENATPVPCTVLDPFGGSGTTGQVAQNCGCHAILIEINPEYIAMQKKRVEQETLF